jgi:hypothetical protein
MIIMVFLATAFGSGWGAPTFLVSACGALDSPLSEPWTCPMVAMLGACYPVDEGSPMEVPSLRIRLLFFLEGAVRLDEPS